MGGRPKRGGDISFALRRCTVLQVASHPCAQSGLAQRILQRLRSDVAYLAQRLNSKPVLSLKGFGPREPEARLLQGKTGRLVARAQEMLRQLRCLHAHNVLLEAAARRCLAALTDPTDAALGAGPGDDANAEAAARARAARQLLRWARYQLTPGLPYLMDCLMSRCGDAALGCLLHSLTPEQLALVPQVVALVMLANNRRTHTVRCMTLTRQLVATLESPGADPVTAGREIEAQAAELLRAMACERHYMASEEGGAGRQYDPRFLAFEFLNGLLLREGQV